MPILGELKLRDSHVQLVGMDNKKQEFQGVYSANQHLLYMYIDLKGPVCFGRYAEGRNRDFAGLGSVVFRPAGFRVEAHGFAPYRRLQCWLGESSFDVLQTLVRGWTPEALSRTLDIRARSLSLYMARLAAEITRPGFASGVAADAILILALSDIAQFIAGQQPDVLNHGAGRWTAAGDRAMKKVIERINDLAEATPTIEELAQLAAMDKRRLLREFKSACGVSLVAYVRDMRLQRAQHYLAFTDMSLAQVSDLLGFSSSANFSTAFRHEMNVTPREYRRERRPRVGYARTLPA